MGLTVTYHNPDYPDGTEFGVEGIGMLKNNEATEISEETEQAFANSQGITIKDAFEGSEIIKVEGEATATPEEQPQGTQMPEEEVPGEENGGEEATPTTEQEGTGEAENQESA